MPLVGGGGAGNTAGSNPTGIGSGLNYVGNLAYGYSGQISTSAGNFVPALDFVTGNEVLNTTVQLYVDDTTPIGQDDAYGMRIKSNGEVIMLCVMDNRGTPKTRQLMNNIDLIIPPFTHIEIELFGESAETDFATFLVTGEIMNA